MSSTTIASVELHTHCWVATQANQPDASTVGDVTILFALVLSLRGKPLLTALDIRSTQFIPTLAAGVGSASTGQRRFSARPTTTKAVLAEKAARVAYGGWCEATCAWSLAACLGPLDWGKGSYWMRRESNPVRQSSRLCRGQILLFPTPDSKPTGGGGGVVAGICFVSTGRVLSPAQDWNVSFCHPVFGRDETEGWMN
ncbi:hypothetical protein PG985_015441 [Apiospora marii]|uniref:Uncharacterized protein n=1 Tax=Apiospora marii TaxID=335849 RepID=A0ABR1S5U0_9PEZI